MTQVIEAVYEDGVLKPIGLLKIKEHSKVRIVVESNEERLKKAEEIVKLARRSNEGLSEKELSVMESNRLSSERFWGSRMGKDI